MLMNSQYSIIGAIMEIVVALFKGMDWARVGQLIKQKVGNQPIQSLIDIWNITLAMGANTMHHQTFIDAMAFKQLIENQNGFDEAELILPDYVRINGTVCPIGGMLKARVSRYAMDGNGYHVGYESCYMVWPLYDRRHLDLDAGYPNLISSFVVIPDQMEVTELTQALDQGCLDQQCDECKKHHADDSDWDCSNEDCGQYYPADADFMYEHYIHSIRWALEHGQLIEAEFTRYDVIKQGEIHDSMVADVQPRVWSIGDHEVDLDALINEKKSLGNTFVPSLWDLPDEPWDGLIMYADGLRKLNVIKDSLTANDQPEAKMVADLINEIESINTK